MKVVVDSLPYYQETCPFEDKCYLCDSGDCPKMWDKYYVCSKDNPHECNFLIEYEKAHENYIKEKDKL